MFTILQVLLYGRTLTADKHVSDSKMFIKLAGKTDKGKIPVYGDLFYFRMIKINRNLCLVNEWDGSSKLFNNAVKGKALLLLQFSHILTKQKNK